MIRLAVRCRPEQAEFVLAELTVLAPNGVEEERGEGYVEYALYGAEGELPELGQIEAAAGEGLVEVVSTTVPDDWAERWRDFHRPVTVADRLRVTPSWEAEGEGGAELEIVVDPGRAFGTGAHPTTRLCLELMLELADAGEASGPLADLGTGSGVLAIAAALLGWDPVLACDHEQAAVEAAAANAVRNGAAVQARRLDLREAEPPPAPTTVANLTSPILRAVAERLREPPRTLVCSGLMAGEEDGAAAAFARAGLHEVERRREGDWAALLMRAG